MRMKMLGAASLAAIALVACAKKEAVETPAVEETAAVEEPAADISDDAATAADVYAAPTSIDLSTVRTKDALSAAADAAFTQVDADANGSLSQSEFYALAALMTPATPDAAAAADVVTDEAGAVVDDTAAAEAVEGVAAEEPTADASALDASFATIAGADASLTADDLRTAFLTKFDAADVNLDGTLDDAESATFSADQPF